MKTMKRKDVDAILRKHGFRATKGRVALIETLSKCSKPESMEEITKLVSRSLDAANVYRALEAFAKTEIARKIDFQNGRTYYELSLDRHHHHHIVCTKCGRIEDIRGCKPKLEKEALTQAKSFSSIDSHSLEFFGTCKTCDKKINN